MTLTEHFRQFSPTAFATMGVGSMASACFIAFTPYLSAPPAPADTTATAAFARIQAVLPTLASVTTPLDKAHCEALRRDEADALNDFSGKATPQQTVTLEHYSRTLNNACP